MDGQPVFPSPSTGSVDVPPGSRLSLECETFGVPNPTTTWLRNEMPITPGGRFSIGGRSNLDGVSVSMLEVTNMGKNDTGVYTCLASSEAGTSSKGTLITVVGEPAVTAWLCVTAVYRADCFIVRSRLTDYCQTPRGESRRH